MKWLVFSRKKELTTYAGTTIVENDADCYMEVSAGGGDTLRAKKLALLLGDQR